MSQIWPWTFTLIFELARFFSNAHCLIMVNICVKVQLMNELWTDKPFYHICPRSLTLTMDLVTQSFLTLDRLICVKLPY